jgi:hypothetical protein
VASDVSSRLHFRIAAARIAAELARSHAVADLILGAGHNSDFVWSNRVATRLAVANRFAGEGLCDYPLHGRHLCCPHHFD